MPRRMYWAHGNSANVACVAAAASRRFAPSKSWRTRKRCGRESFTMSFYMQHFQLPLDEFADKLVLRRGNARLRKINRERRQPDLWTRLIAQDFPQTLLEVGHVPYSVEYRNRDASPKRFAFHF